MQKILIALFALLFAVMPAFAIDIRTCKPTGNNLCSWLKGCGKPGGQCKNCEMHGNTIKTQCKDRAGVFQPTILNHTGDCKAINNMNGNLTCDN